MTTTVDDLTTAPQGPFFRFPNEATGMAALATAGLLSEDGTPILASHAHSLDIVGVISRGGEWDEEGNVITPPEVLDGWHLNYLGPLPDGWEQYAVFPKQPTRVWA